ncbi:MAG: PASTA domain-containing protein [bacterium]|nr:PASTA domain-containing protein [bacterium]
MRQKAFKRRVYISGLVVILVSVAFIFKLFFLHFSNKVVVPAARQKELRRGLIKDRNGCILALSIESKSLFANPKKIINARETARRLSPFLGYSVKRIQRKLEQNKRFVWLKRKLDAETTGEIANMRIKGLHFKQEYKRVYPHEQLASNIIGFVGIDNNGLEGIEYLHNPVLSRSSEQDDVLVLANNISLTIDRFIQHVAERELALGVEKNKAKQGAVVVLEVKTGRILALAKYPNFDLNYYYRYSANSRRNFGIVNAFEPGSTVKIISLAAIMEKYPFLLKQKFLCTGKSEIGETTINCTGTHGTVGMEEVIKHSCNAGIIEAMKRVKKEDLHAALKKFGFGKRIGIELPAEAEGVLRSPGQWSGLSKYTVSIGYEVSATTIQLAAAFAAIANKGVYMVPSIIESVEDHEGAPVQLFTPRSRGRVLSEKKAKQVLRIMKGVVEQDGTGKRAASAYYTVAGKTGTSRKFSRQGGGYSSKVMASFIGIAPYEAPEVCVLVLLDEPAESLSGGKTAAPIFSAVINRILPQMGVKNTGIKAKPPLRAGISKLDFDGKTMPDFTGLRLPEAVRLLIRLQGERGIRYSISGEGTVFTQRPEAGKSLERDEQVVLYLQ